MNKAESPEIPPERAEELIRLQSDLFQKVTNALRNFKKDSSERHTKAYFDIRLEKLQKMSIDFNKRHVCLVQALKDANNKYFTEDIADKFEEAYINAISIITEACNIKFPEVHEEGASLVRSETMQSSILARAVRLPKIAVPSFSGKYTDWPTFYDSFLRLVHENSAIVEIEKFHYLKQSMPSNFDSDIRDIPLTAANYKEAWKVLVSRYNNTRVLFTHYMNLLSSQAPIVKEKASNIKHLLDTSRSCVSALRHLKVKIDECDEIIVHFLTSKLPRETRQLWEQNLGQSISIPNFKQFTEFLETRYRTLEAMEYQHSVSVPHYTEHVKPQASLSRSFTKNSPRETKNHHLTTSPGNQSFRCPACKDSHILRRCPKFLKMDYCERRAVADSSKLCFNCLSTTHTVSTCLSNKNCQQCGQRHHTLLHTPFNQQPATASGAIPKMQPTNSQILDIPQSSNTTHSATYHIGQTIMPIVSYASKFTSESEVLLPTALINIITANGQSFALRALIDQGSTGALISERAAQSLRLERLPITSTIKLADGQKSVGNHVTRLTIESRIDRRFNFTVVAAIVKTVTEELPSKTIVYRRWTHLQGIELADPEFYRTSAVDLLLGADVLGTILMQGIRKGGLNEPIAQQTRLGWIVSGVASGAEAEQSQSYATSCAHVSLEQLDSLVRKFYTLENVPHEHQYTAEENWCEEFFKQTHKRQLNGKYIVRLPLKSILDPNLRLGKSKQTALNRFHSLERKLSRSQTLSDQYSSAIQEYFDLHQIAVAETSESHHFTLNRQNQPNYTCCTLPHHAVIREDSATTKCRVVFDASAVTSSGNSLNDLLCKGPPLQNDLSAILLNWRLHKYVITADIEKMYRCIDVRAADTQYQRILWHNKEGQIEEYRLTTVTFGTASAPYTAIRVMLQLADDEKERYPLAVKVLKTQMYVDDVFIGGDCIKQVLKIRNETQGALGSAGFKLHKWATNLPILLDGIKSERQDTACAIQLNLDEIIKTLGMCWQPSSDTFQYRLKFELNFNLITKRAVLSTIAKLFDPLGLINPVIVSAKIFLKHLWSLNLDWDDPLPTELSEEWIRFLDDLPTIHSIQIPRWLNVSEMTSRQVELHAFCDGSMQAYASIVYLRIQDENKQFHTNILTAKSRVTPKPPICIPRIELCAAVLSIKLVQWVLKHLSLSKENVPIYYWTDSTIVLSWIRGDIRRWPVFVSNRIGLIHSASDINQWHHISTHENPADHSSRGLTATELLHCTLYWKGPKWLGESRQFWPQTDWTFLEPEQLVNTIVQSRDTSFIARYSSFSRLRRITAWIRRFCHNCRLGKGERSKGPLTVIELHQSLFRLIRLVQSECFMSEKRSLSKGEGVPHKSPLFSLNPFIDPQDIIRVGGRLQRSLLSYDEKHPIILPRAHHFTKLIIEDAHVNTLHGGISLTSSFIRKRFWILNAAKTIQMKLRTCIKCFREKPKISQQLMGSLPIARVTPSLRPFISTGIDFTAAIELKASRYRGNTTYKGYIAIFICLSTKAVHLEAVTGMSTDQMLCALHRFIGRRGLCHDIYSDCGTNFIGANTVLKTNAKTFRESFENHIIPQLSERGIQWHFNPPHSPNFGGLWEANIKSVKYHLKRITTGTPMTYEDLSTVLARIEACLNSRPLCPLTANADDLTVLTPGHFLIGDSLLAPPEPPVPEPVPQRQYLKIQRMIQQFWAKWSSEWLSHLQSRPKWCSQQVNLQIGDLVLIKEDRLPPQQWQLGRIVNTHPGEDQLVRVVTIRTKSGTYRRCVSKVCRLPIETPYEGTTGEV